MPRWEPRTFGERFWAKVEIAYFANGFPNYDPCWLWKGGKSQGNGTVRGLIRADAPSRQRIYAHRAALILWCGEDRPGYDACHGESCTDGLCCNPTHLSWGTHRENMRQYIKRYGGIAVAKRPAPPAPTLLLRQHPGEDR